MVYHLLLLLILVFVIGRPHSTLYASDFCISLWEIAIKALYVESLEIRDFISYLIKSEFSLTIY